MIETARLIAYNVYYTLHNGGDFMRFKPLIVVLSVVILLSGCGSSTEKEPVGTPVNEPAEKIEKSIWLDGYTDIGDFSYYLDGDELHIKDYTADNTKVRIAPAYEIDGTTYHVTSFEDATFFCKGVENVIIPDGTRYMESNTFNSSDLKYLYLSDTLVEVEDTFWGYFHGLDKIYYGGTQDEWNKLCTVDRGDIDVKEIIFEQNPDELK